MKRSHKFQLLQSDVASALASTPNLSAAARRLRINRSSLNRWIRAGKVTVPKKPRTRASGRSPNRRKSAAAWARSVRKKYDLTATEMTLVSLAERALTLALDPTATPETWMAAMTRYQRLVKQLDLEEETEVDGEAAQKIDDRPWPRRVG